MSVQVVYLILLLSAVLLFKDGEKDDMRLDGWMCEKDFGG